MTKEVAPLPALTVAAYEGDLDCARRCLDKGADVNQVATISNVHGDMLTGVTPLYVAAQGGHYAMCKYLFKRGADPTCLARVPAKGYEHTAADVAIGNGNWKIWWYLTSRKYIARCSSSTIKDKEARSAYRALDDDIAHHKPDQSFPKALM